MKPSLGRTRLFCLAFVAMLLAFNWPLMSIPGPGKLLAWLFEAWGAAIVLLFLISRRPDRVPDSGEEPPGEHGAAPPSPGEDADV